MQTLTVVIAYLALLGTVAISRLDYAPPADDWDRE